jgi:hypothetical protein
MDLVSGIEPLFPISHLVVVEWGDSLFVDLWLARVWREQKEKQVIKYFDGGLVSLQCLFAHSA